jgi:molybdopterin synthase sulfur carrier subunit
VNTLKITVQFLGNVREATGTREQTFDISESTMQALIDRMSKEYGDDFKRTLIHAPAGRATTSVVIALNGVDIEALEGVKTNLKEGDIVSIFPPVAGGSDIIFELCSR